MKLQKYKFEPEQLKGLGKNKKGFSIMRKAFFYVIKFIECYSTKFPFRS